MIEEPVQPLEIEPSKIKQDVSPKTITRVASTTLNNNFILVDGQVSTGLPKAKCTFSVQRFVVKKCNERPILDRSQIEHSCTILGHKLIHLLMSEYVMK